MLDKCANPNCYSPFLKFRDGKLFALHIEACSSAGIHARRTKHFWLCSQCCLTMTVVPDGHEGIRVVPFSAVNTPEKRTA